MPSPRPFPTDVAMPPRATHPGRGFTLIEMLLVVAIISLLIAILLPSLRYTNENAQISVCMNNQRQMHTAFIAYAATNQRRFPYDTDTPNGPWMWDMTRDAAEQLIGSAGGKVDIFFCPSNSPQNATIHWNFSSNYRVLGYFFMFRRHSGPLANFTLAGGKQFVRGFTGRYDHSTQEIASDANLASGGNFSHIMGGSPIPHRSAHLNPSTLKPTGGNILFLDGHAAWRPFAEMQLRYWGPEHWY